MANPPLSLRFIIALGASFLLGRSSRTNSNFYELVKSLHYFIFVIPAKVGIQQFQVVMDSHFRGSDGYFDFLRIHQFLMSNIFKAVTPIHETTGVKAFLSDSCKHFFLLMHFLYHLIYIQVKNLATVPVIVDYNKKEERFFL